MATGQPYSNTIHFDVAPETAIERVMARPFGYRAVRVAPNSVMLERRYIPTWAIVVGIVGLLFFLLGVLLFFVRKTETLTVTAERDNGGSRVTFYGTATPLLIQGLSHAISGQPPTDWRPTHI
jgi:hypothetical protein